MLKFKPKRKFMEIAIEQAKQAFERGDYPIGACMVRNDKVVAMAGNRVKSKNDSTKHVELELIQYVVGMNKDPYLEDCVLYTTHEPCPMCSGAAVWARLGGIVYGANIDDFVEFTDEKKYRKWRVIKIPCKTIIRGKNIKLEPDFMRKECIELFKLEKSD
jgi:tRNA(adenine34) deaminase